MDVKNVVPIDQLIASQATQKQRVSPPKFQLGNMPVDTFDKSEKNKKLIDEQLNLLAKDFCSTKPQNLQEKVMKAIHWGSGALCAYAAGDLVAKNSGLKPSEELISTVKVLLDPR